MHVKALNFLILVILFFKAPPSWGLFISTVKADQYIKQAEALELDKNEKWLRLGHYQKKWFGYKSEFQGDFFISADGPRDPHQELIETLKAFISPTAQQIEKYKMLPQCYFGARFKWLQSQLKFEPSIIDPCQERKVWKQTLNAKSVNLIFAASDLGTATSSFGHTFLKLNNPENANNKDLLDYGINYAADADQSEGFFYAIKGLFGFYAGRFTMLPYHQKIREYTNLEGRDLWEYELDLTESEVDELVDHLLELEHSTSPYYFLSNNCSYQLIKAIEVVKTDVDVSNLLPPFVIPLDTVKLVSNKTKLVKKINYKASLKSDYLKSYDRLNYLQKKSHGEVNKTLSLPMDYELSQVEKAEVYEASMKYYALKSYQADKDLEDEKYKLSVQRARLGNLTSEIKSERPQSPEQGPGSSALYLGYGENLTTGPFQSFKFRSAFHELEQPDLGAVKFSHTEILSFDFRYINQNQKFELSNFTFINLLNSSPVTALNTNVSWKAKAQWLSLGQVNLEGGAGLSFEYDILFKWRVVSLLSAQYTNSYLAGGPNLIFGFKFFENLAASIDAGYYFKTDSTQDLFLKARLDWHFIPGFDLQAEYIKNQEYQIRMFYNFIL